MRLLARIFLQLSVFLYIYSVPLRGMPFGMGSRMLFAMLGFTLLFVNYIWLPARHVKIKKNFLLIWLALIVFISWSSLSIFVNQTRDLSIIKYTNSWVLIMIAGYFIVWLIYKIHKHVNFKLIANYMIMAVFIQACISLLMFIIPPFQQLMSQLQQLDFATEKKLGDSQGIRLLGFGSTFFTSGIVNGYCLILIAATIKYFKPTYKKLLLYIFLFVFITLIGIMMARTTLIGLVMALVILFFPLTLARKSLSRISLKLVGIFGQVIICLALIYLFLPVQTKETINNAGEFGFELFINYVRGEGLTSASTDELKTMYVFPSDVKTYLIGDGRFVDPIDPLLYYKETDIGFLRLLYYFGIIGIILFLVIQCILVIIGIRNYGHQGYIKLFFAMTFLYMLTLNLKGFTDLFFLNILFCYYFKNSYGQHYDHRREARALS